MISAIFWCLALTKIQVWEKGNDLSVIFCWKPAKFSIYQTTARDIFDLNKNEIFLVQWIVMISCSVTFVNCQNFTREKNSSTMASRKFVLNLKNSHLITRNFTGRASTLYSSSTDSSKNSELREVTHTGQVNRRCNRSYICVVLWLCYAKDRHSPTMS